MNRNHEVDCPTCEATPGRLCRGMDEDTVHVTRAIAAADYFRTPCEHRCHECETEAGEQLRFSGAALQMTREVMWLKRVLDGELASTQALRESAPTMEEHEFRRGQNRMAMDVLTIVNDILAHQRERLSPPERMDENGNPIRPA